MRSRPGGNTAQTSHESHADSNGVDIRLLLVTAQRDYSHVRVRDPALPVAVLSAHVFQRPRRRDELNRLQPVPLRLPEAIKTQIRLEQLNKLLERPSTNAF